MVQGNLRNVVSPDPPQITTAEAEAMARAVVKLFEEWKLSDGVAREIVGGMSERTYARWKGGDPGRIDADLSTRLSLLMGIHTRLRNIFTNPDRGCAWIAKPNSAFGGSSPADIMGQGHIFSLARVRDYLDAECSGW
jgi:uncharacterized protein (DUF2384 family)